MKQFFPFGRGDRGSRQRLVLEFSRRGDVMVVKRMRVKVLRTHEPDLTVLNMGVSTFEDASRLVFTSRFFDGAKTFLQAVRDFKQVRKANKLWQHKRKVNGGTGR